MWTSPDRRAARKDAPARPVLGGAWAPIGALVAALALDPADRLACRSPDPGDAIALAAAGRVLLFAAADPACHWAILAIAAAARLGATGAEELVGCGQPGRRIWLYHQVRPLLPAPSRAHWDRREGWIRGGLITATPEAAGRWERTIARQAGALARLPGPVRAALVQALFARRVGGRPPLRARAGVPAAARGGGAPAPALGGAAGARVETEDGGPVALEWWGRAAPAGPRGAALLAGWRPRRPPPCPPGMVPRPALAQCLASPVAGAPWVYAPAST